jgi:[acyl-carrier-protein] S-malonyltransferase
VSLGYLQLLVEKGLTADVVLGHSLGEITALGAAGVVTAPDAVAIATKRGMFMDEMAAKVNGGMMAVIMVPLAQVEELLEELNEPDRIVLANDNSPKQVVVAGDIEMLDAFAAKVKERNLGTCRKLIVAGPWHSHYMTEARVAFEEWAEPIHFGHPETPIILNATAKEEAHPTTIKHLVTWQLTAPVFWRECMERLHALEIDTLVEIGPGRVLSGLARVNGFKGDVKVYNVNNMRGLEAAAKELAE